MAGKTSRKMIAAMQVSLDGFVEDADGKTDRFESWADAIQRFSIRDSRIKDYTVFQLDR